MSRLEKFELLLAEYDSASEDQSIAWWCVSDDEPGIDEERKKRDQLFDDLRKQIIEFVKEQ